jgi:hypothetical protein
MITHPVRDALFHGDKRKDKHMDMKMLVFAIDCEIDMFHVPCINNMRKLKKKQTNALGFISVILYHSNHQHVSATYVAIFRVVRKEYQYNYNVKNTSQLQII